MERHNRFDEAIKARLGGLEDEPSQRVWTGVRDAIGTIRPPEAARSPWVFRVAAAVTVLAVVGLGYLVLPNGAATQKATAVNKKARIQVVPLDREGKKDVYLADEKKEAVTPVPNVRKRDGFIANVPQPAPRDQETPKPEMKEAPAPEKVIANQDVPKLDNPPAPSPDNGGHDQLSPLEDKRNGQPVLANANTKRSIRLPGRDDLTADNLRSKSGAILGAVTNGANEFLGLNANYNERQEEDLKMTAFNADFGLFKIKRVKTVKQ